MLTKDSSRKFFSFRYISKLIFSIFCLSFLYNSLRDFGWGYDEFGIFISILEFRYAEFVEVYVNLFNEIGLKNSDLSILISENILKYFIVPIRWTYAIGISPLYSLLIFESLGWEMQKFILMIPHLLLIFFGVFVIFRVLDRLELKDPTKILFISFLFFSFPFWYWSLTLTSYSYHIFCFGLLLYSECLNSYQKNTILNKNSLARTAVTVFNYQYIPVLAFIGLIELLQYKKSFFTERRFYSWILPGISSLLAFVFIKMRSSIFGVHSAPELSTLSEDFTGIVNRDSDGLYDLFSNSFGILDSFKFVAERFYDIFYYLFFEQDFTTLISSSYTQLQIYETLLFYLIIIVGLYLFCRSDVAHSLKSFLLKFLLAYFLIYIFGVIPFTPSRHSLVLLLPLLLVISIIISHIFSRKFKVSYKYGAVCIFIISMAFNFYSYKPNQSSIDELKMLNILSSYKVDSVLLMPCDYEPLFHNKLRNEFNIVYRCGSKIVKKINSDDEFIAVFSKKKYSYEDVNTELNFFSDKFWYKSAEVKGSLLCKNKYVNNKNIKDCSDKIIFYRKKVS